jgi:hypothetical protein
LYTEVTLDYGSGTLPNPRVGARPPKGMRALFFPTVFRLSGEHSMRKKRKGMRQARQVRYAVVGLGHKVPGQPNGK